MNVTDVRRSNCLEIVEELERSEKVVVERKALSIERVSASPW